jgi:hypothetical protein
MVGGGQFGNDARFYLSGANLRKAISFAPRLLTSPFRMLPDFMVIGFPKCGTTSLYGFLTKHPSICAAFQKETTFFTLSYRRGMLWYRAFFPTVIEKRFSELRGRKFITGEASPGYVYFPDIHGKIFRMNPKIRLIALMRNPVDRAYSNYMHLVRRGYDKSMEEAIQDDVENKQARPPSYNILTGGIYFEPLKCLLEVVPRGQVLLLKAEDFFDNPKKITNECFRFLGLPEHELGGYPKLNKGEYGGMDAETRARLEEFYRPHNAMLYRLVGRDFGW